MNLGSKDTKFHHKIGVRLGLTFGFILFFSVLSLTGIFIFREYTSVKSQFTEEVNQFREFAQVALPVPLWTLNKEEVKSICIALENFESALFLGFSLEDSEGQTLFTTPDFMNAIKSETQSFDILYEGKKAGKINFATREVETMQELRDTSLKYFLFIAALGCLVALMIYQLANYFVGRPIVSLLKSMKSVQENTFVTVDSLQFDYEFRNLATEYNKAVVAIFERDQLLRQENHKLEGEVKEKDHALEEAKMISIQSSRLASLGEMAAGIAHEINNPLTIIVNTNVLQRRILDKLEVSDLEKKEKLLKNLEKIDQTCQRITKIIKGLLTFARDGQRDPLVEVSLKEIIQESLEFSQNKLNKNGIRIEPGNVAENCFAPVRSVELSQVIVNLISNSSDALEQSEEKWVRVDLIDKSTTAQIIVTDSGKGISPELAKKIMQPFFTTKPVGKGTGLGLSISYGIIKNHGGEMWINHASANTQFIIEIPKNLHPRRAAS